LFLRVGASFPPLVKGDFILLRDGEKAGMRGVDISHFDNGGKRIFNIKSNPRS